MKNNSYYSQARINRRTSNTCHVLLLLILTWCAGTVFAGDAITINNPYEGVSWDLAHRFKANFHTHTTNSDGALKPHEAVDEYKALGYAALAITDHGMFTFPWTEFSKLKPGSGKGPGKETPELRTGWEDRDPETVGMTSIKGNELSLFHHMVHLWTDCDSDRRKFMVQILDSQKQGGQMIFAHPGRYGWQVFEKNQKEKMEKQKKKGNETGNDTEKDSEKDEQVVNFPFPNPLLENSSGWSIEKYVYFFKNYEHIIGLEVYNAGDKYPQDRQLWDEVLKKLMPDRPVWGFSNDDMHQLEQLGRNQSILLVEKPTIENIKIALAKGQFLFAYCPKAREGSKPPTVKKISVDKEKLIISVEVEEAQKFEWLSDGKVVGTESSLNLSTVTDLGNYVRLMIYGSKDDTVIGTQPFGIVRKK